MRLLQRLAMSLAWLVLTGQMAGCSTPASLLLFAVEQSNGTEKDPTCLTAGCAAFAVVQHAYDKFTEGDPTPCRKLNTVARALNPRCGAYQPGSLVTKDVTTSGLPHCPLSLATRNPKFWPMLPELQSKGAQPEACQQPPLLALAQAQPCPDFAAASPQSLQALRLLADTDPRAVQHDVVRMLSCPAAQTARLDTVLEAWRVKGLLPSNGLPFSVLSALHPDYLGSSLARKLEQQGHIAAAALGTNDGALPSGFDLALRSANYSALNWWLDRVPSLANRVPAARSNQLPWAPLARVITPSYLDHVEQQGPLIAYLLKRGADPWRPLPHEPTQSVVSYARQLKSPFLPVLDPPLLMPKSPSVRAASLAPTVLGAGVAGPSLAVAPR